MMVHLFLTDDSHRMFKAIQPAVSVPPKSADLECLYTVKDGVGYFESPQRFLYIPLHRVQEIRFTRRAGDRWV